MQNLSIFQYNQSQVRTFTDSNNELWFLVNDVCAILDYKNPRRTVELHCKPKGVTKRYTPTESGKQEMVYINEPNLYRLIIKSRKSEAQFFEEWVMEEVLPSIRKTGSYLPEKLPLPQSATPSLGHKHESVLFNKQELANLINHVDWCFYWFQYVSSPLELLNKNLINHIQEHFTASHVTINLISQDCNIPLLSKQKMRNFPWQSNDLEKIYEYLKSH